MALISYMVEVPVTIRLRLDSLKIERAVGGMVATQLRRMLKQGRVPGGKPLRHPKDPKHGRPLNRTGQLIRSVRYSRSGGYVAPNGYRTDPGRTRGREWKRNYAVYAILVRSNLQPGLEVDAELARKMSAKAEEAIARQLQRPGFGLQAELKRISRGYR